MCETLFPDLSQEVILNQTNLQSFWTGTPTTSHNHTDMGFQCPLDREYNTLGQLVAHICIFLATVPILNQLGWKRPLKTSSPTYDQTPPHQLDHGTKCHIQSSLKHLQGW